MTNDQERSEGTAVTGRTVSALLAAILLLFMAAAAFAEERTIFGTLTKLDRAARTLTVTDGKGVPWNFNVDRNAGIDLGAVRLGDRVRVEIARATPLNMMSAADLLRRGDKLIRIRDD